MHIPDGYLGPATYGTLFAAMAPVWAWASRSVRGKLHAKHIPLLAMGSAFSFVIMMFNVPAPGGTSGHAVGAALVGIVLGPAAAVISVSIAVIVQALLFGDGGVTAIGADCFNMAFVMPVVGCAAYRLVSLGSRGASRRRVVAATISGYAALNASALCTAVELGLQPLLAQDAKGMPLFFPYPLGVTVPVFLGEHLLLFGWIEAVVTGSVVAYLLKVEPRLFINESGLDS